MLERGIKMTSIATAAACILALTACAGSQVAEVSTNTDVNNVSEVIEVKAPEYKTEDYYSAWTSENSIILNGSNAVISGAGAKADGSNIEITQAGTYVVSGTLDNGQIKVNAGKDDIVRLVFNGISITSASASPVYVKQADKVIITLADGTENIITDGSEYVFSDSETEPDSTVFSKDDLTFNGTGSLTVNSNYNDAIKTKDDLVIMSGTFNINSVDNAVVGKDSVTVKDAVVNITADGDGIRTNNAEKGEIVIENGTFNINVKGDGIQSESTVYLIDGNYNITTGEGGDKVVSTGGMTPPNMGERPDNMPPQNMGEHPDDMPPQNMGERPDNMPPQNMGERPDNMPPQNMGERPNRPSRSDNNDNFNAVQTNSNQTEDTGTSIKGIKAVNNIVIDGGSFDLSTEDDAIHSDNSLSVKNGTINIKTGDDGIHSDNILNILGGNINITNSYEGIEGAKINISGGNIRVKASDDGLNAADGSENIPMQANDNTIITISGGYLYIDSGCDGIDSNGNIYMNGGTVIVNGPTNGGESALDYDGICNVDGGVLIAAGSSGMAQSISQASKQAGMMINLPNTQEAGSAVKIIDSNGNNILTFSPSKQYQTVVVSMPEIKTGENYTIYYNGTASGESVNGVYSAGEYINGKTLADFAMTEQSSNVSISGVTAVSGGMMQPHNGGHGDGKRPDNKSDNGVMKNPENNGRQKQ